MQKLLIFSINMSINNISFHKKNQFWINKKLILNENAMLKLKD